MSTDSSNLCRICYEPVHELIQYCNCDGTTGNIHFECLKKWIIERDYNLECEICNSNYNLILTSKANYLSFTFSNNYARVTIIYICFLIFFFIRSYNQMDTLNYIFTILISVIILFSLVYKLSCNFTRSYVIEPGNSSTII